MTTILEALWPHASLFGFVWEGDDLSKRAGGLVASLEPFLVAEEDNIREWPGSRLPDDWDETLDGSVKRWLYHFNLDVVRIVGRECERLFDWVNPDLPQDLHLLNDYREPVFGSITTEGDAWVELSDEEWQQMVANLPEIG